MNDDPALLDRQSAYLDTLRTLYRPYRTAGFIACLLGAMLLILARFRFGAGRARHSVVDADKGAGAVPSVAGPLRATAQARDLPGQAPGPPTP